MIEDAGHMPQQDHPERFNAALRTALRAAGRRVDPDDRFPDGTGTVQ
ncbi:hypothetical protein ACFVHW_05195 [Streptomyces sp. NPDC127110]